MAIKVAINGFGRIGRLAFRNMFKNKNFKIVAINDLTDAETLAYLLKYDTAQGGFMRDQISFDEKGNLIVAGKKFPVFAEKDPSNLPWAKLGVDVVIESTGIFTSAEKAQAHINAGAKKVVISAPATGEGVKTIVANVNDNILNGSEKIISAASCTTNCLAPVLKVINDNFGVEKAMMTTIHAYTGDQAVMDGPHKKGIFSRRGRAAAANIVPTSTGAAKAIGLVLPELAGKIDGTSLRVPVITGSIVDLTVELKKKTTLEEVDKAFKAADSETLKYQPDPVVSSDVIGDTHGAVYDADSTQLIEVNGKQLLKVLAWYDNEMSYVAQFVRTMEKIASLEEK